MRRRLAIDHTIEVAGPRGDEGKSTLPQNIIAYELTSRKLVCENCALTSEFWIRPTADCFGIKDELFQETRTTDFLDGLLDEHERIELLLKSVFVKKLPGCLIVQLLCVRYMRKEDSIDVIDKDE